MAHTIAAKQGNIDKALDAPIPAPAQIAPSVNSASATTAEAADENPMPLLLPHIFHACLRQLARADADHAAELNGRGFSRFDGKIGHRLAAQQSLSPADAQRALAIVCKYPRQLPGKLFKAATVN